MKLTQKSKILLSKKNIIKILCERLTEETGLFFFPWEDDNGFRPNDYYSKLETERSKGEPIRLNFKDLNHEFELGYYIVDEENKGKFCEQLLASLARQIFQNLSYQSNESKKENNWSWESLLAAAIKNEWNNSLFENEALKNGLMLPGYGFPVLIRCRTQQANIHIVIKNLFPQCIVCWSYLYELFLFIPIKDEVKKKNYKIQQHQSWAESVIPEIYSLLASELGVQSFTCIGNLIDSNLFEGYKELQRLADTFSKYFPGEAGLVEWKLGLTGLLAEIPKEIYTRYQSEVLGDINLSDELKETLDVYFASSMSISETARNLIIHRNTLNYRLDKIMELTKYNPREFQDAILLYICFWFKKHLM